MKKLPIFFSFDDGYVTPAAVALESLLTNAKGGVFYELFVLHLGVSDENQRRLRELVARHGNGHLTFVSALELLGATGVSFDNRSFSLVQGGARFTQETLLRCLPMLVPEFECYDRIIYSDVDICVVDDISELYDLDLGDNYLAGCRIPAFLSDQTAHFPENLRERYVAGGIWMLNLHRLRQDDIGSKVKDLIRNPPFRMIWNDQDVMNLACGGKVTFISYRYCSIPFWKSTLDKSDYYDDRYPAGELREAMFRPKIVHYAHNKPWNGYCQDGEIWHYWLSRTEFRNSIQGHQSAKSASVYLFKYLRLPNFIVSWVARDGELVVKVLGFLLRVRMRGF